MIGPRLTNGSVIEHVLAVWPWHDWDELLEWLRGDGPGDPGFNPEELRDCDKTPNAPAAAARASSTIPTNC